MKKLISTIKKALPMCLALALLLPLFTCKKAETPLATPEPTAIVTEQPTAAPTEAPEPTLEPEAQKQAEIAARVLEYCELIQPAIAELSAQLEHGGMTVKAFAEGRDLIYEYTLTSIEGAGVDSRPLQESLDAQGAALKENYYELEAYAGDDSVRLIVRYKQGNGRRLFDYVIDKDYEPNENSTGIEVEGYASLAELVESEFFAAQLEAVSTSVWAVSAEAEGDTTLVINHTLKRELSESALRQYKNEWEKSLERDGKGMTDMMHTYVELLVPSVDPSEVAIIYRLYEVNGGLVSEYRAYEQPGEA